MRGCTVLKHAALRRTACGTPPLIKSPGMKMEFPGTVHPFASLTWDSPLGLWVLEGENGKNIGKNLVSVKKDG